MGNTNEKISSNKDEAETIEELKRNILANISHELRTPITVAKAAIELVEYEDDPKEKAECLRMALDALARLNLIVEDLIEASKIMKSEIKPKYEAVDILELIHFICKSLETELKRKGIELYITGDTPLPPVKADRNMLKHALRNIISNAIKFNKEGGKITIYTEKKREFIKIFVIDTGIGIPTNKINKIFDVLFQIDSSPTRRYGGTGMGLAIAKDIIKIHGGRIDVTSKIGEGSTFCITLPLKT